MYKKLQKHSFELWLLHCAPQTKASVHTEVSRRTCVSAFPRGNLPLSLPLSVVPYFGTNRHKYVTTRPITLDAVCLGHKVTTGLKWI